MSDEVQQTFQDIAAHGTAMSMVIRCEEMPAIYVAATQGDQDAQMRLSAVAGIMPHVAAGEHTCLFCDRQTTPNDLAALVFISKKIEKGQDALFCLVCNECDTPHPEQVAEKVMTRLNFKRLLHEAGHA